jgi:hypothetical protein
MKSVVVDDEKARRARRILYALRFSFIRSERLSRHANHLAIAETKFPRIIGEVAEIYINARWNPARRFAIAANMV